MEYVAHTPPSIEQSTEPAVPLDPHKTATFWFAHFHPLSPALQATGELRLRPVHAVNSLHDVMVPRHEPRLSRVRQPDTSVNGGVAGSHVTASTQALTSAGSGSHAEPPPAVEVPPEVGTPPVGETPPELRAPPVAATPPELGTPPVPSGPTGVRPPAALPPPAASAPPVEICRTATSSSPMTCAHAMADKATKPAGAADQT
jgi:hypothetical protein